MLPAVVSATASRRPSGLKAASAAEWVTDEAGSAHGPVERRSAMSPRRHTMARNAVLMLDML